VAFLHRLFGDGSTAAASSLQTGAATVSGASVAGYVMRALGTFVPTGPAFVASAKAFASCQARASDKVVLRHFGVP
jgi:hypothetical protein